MIFWNYLRVRGEYFAENVKGKLGAELPPRARRIQIMGNTGETPSGTTSACAENTRVEPHNIISDRNYLRVRGEYAG